MKKNNAKILFVFLCMLFLSIVPKNIFAENNSLTGEWIEAKWAEPTLVLGYSTQIRTHKILNIENDNLSIHESDNIKQNKINYRVQKKDGITFLYLDDCKYLKQMNENMLLYYDDCNISPILFVRKGHDINFSGKNIFGKWIVKDTSSTGDIFYFRKKELLIKSIGDGDIRKAKFLIKRNGSNTYDWMNCVYQAVPISKDIAVLYSICPGPPERRITILQKVK